jgi:hypothetical protein
MPKDSLILRLYSNPIYAEVARLVGYNGIPLAEARKQAEALVQALAPRFPHVEEKELKRRIQDAANELTIVAPGDVLRLNEEARKACHQLLGPAPEHPSYAAFEEQRKTWREEIAGEKAKEEPKRKGRRGRGA